MPSLPPIYDAAAWRIPATQQDIFAASRSLAAACDHVAANHAELAAYLANLLVARCSDDYDDPYTRAEVRLVTLRLPYDPESGPAFGRAPRGYDLERIVRASRADRAAVAGPLTPAEADRLAADYEALQRLPRLICPPPPSAPVGSAPFVRFVLPAPPALPRLQAVVR